MKKNYTMPNEKNEMIHYDARGITKEFARYLSKTKEYKKMKKIYYQMSEEDFDYLNETISDYYFYSKGSKEHFNANTWLGHFMILNGMKDISLYTFFAIIDAITDFDF